LELGGWDDLGVSRCWREVVGQLLVAAEGWTSVTALNFTPGVKALVSILRLMTSDELYCQTEADGLWGLAHVSLSRFSQLSGHYDKTFKPTRGSRDMQLGIIGEDMPTREHKHSLGTGLSYMSVSDMSVRGCACNKDEHCPTTSRAGY
jgi:hypothetical protein